MKLGENDIKLYLGSAEVDKVYLGTTQVYPSEEPTPVPYEEQYLTIETLTAGDLSLADARSNVFNYSLDDGSTWNTLTTGQTVAVEANKKVLFKAQGLTANEDNGIGTIKYAGNFNVYGNAMSLVFGDNFVGQEVMSDYQFIELFNSNSTLLSAENLILPAISLMLNCYQQMFRDCTSLTTAPELPATTLAEYCYSYMFQDCTSLTTAPELPATTLEYRCYQGMFQGCTNLTTAPELPVTTLANECYSNMFNGCTSLTTAPELPATLLKSRCYRYMFQGCTSLIYIKCLATDISASNCTGNWTNGVSSTGTFVKNAAMNDWSTGISGIPSGWSIVNA